MTSFSDMPYLPVKYNVFLLLPCVVRQYRSFCPWKSRYWAKNGPTWGWKFNLFK